MIPSFESKEKYPLSMSPPAGNLHFVHCGGGEGEKKIVHSYHYLHPLDVYFTLNLIIIDTSDRNHVVRD